MIKFRDSFLTVTFFVAYAVLCQLPDFSGPPRIEEWQLLPSPAIISAEIRLNQLRFNLSDAVRSLLDHPDVKRNLKLTSTQIGEVNAALDKYRMDLGLAIENNNKLWRRVGGDQSLESANQAALEKHQQLLRDEIQKIFEVDQLDQFDNCWLKATNNWVAKLDLIVDIPWSGVEKALDENTQNKLQKHYAELLIEFNQEYQGLRTQYQHKWLKGLPQPLQAELKEKLFSAEQLDNQTSMDF